MMPGKKDVVSLKVNGERKHIQKQLILCNLKELHALFRERNPDIKVGFSKFAELRPKECVLVGASGTHSVCVCTTHQNMKLMFEASKIEQMTKNEEKHLMSPQDCLTQIQCGIVGMMKNFLMIISLRKLHSSTGLILIDLNLRLLSNLSMILSISS